MKWKAVAEEMSIGEEKKTAFNTYTTVSCNVMLKLKIQSTKEMEEESKEGGIIDTSCITYSHYIT